MSDDHHHVLITGASSGLGAALASAYAGPGTVLTLLGRDKGRLGAVAGQARAAGSEVWPVAVEVTDRASMAVAITAADDRRPLDLVIANAGIAGGDGAAVLDVNIMGTWHTIEPALARMAPRGQGQLALMSSLAGYRGLPGSAPYCASKAAIRVLAEALRAGWAAQGIRVSAVCPGFVDTPLTRRNRFAMPWLMDADDAAKVIVRGLANNRARIAFPWPLALATRLAAALPPALIDPLLRQGAAGRRR